MLVATHQFLKPRGAQGEVRSPAGSVSASNFSICTSLLATLYCAVMLASLRRLRTTAIRSSQACLASILQHTRCNNNQSTDGCADNEQLPSRCSSSKKNTFQALLNRHFQQFPSSNTSGGGNVTENHGDQAPSHPDSNMRAFLLSHGDQAVGHHHLWQDSWSKQSNKTRAAQLLTTRIKKTRTAEQLQKLLQLDNSNFNAIHLSAAYSRLAKMQRNAAACDEAALLQLLTRLDALLLPQLGNCGPRELAGILWACTTLQRTDVSRVFGSCVAAFMQQVDFTDSPIDISNVLWAAATSSYALHQQEVSPLVCRLLEPSVLRQATTQELSSVLWAVATLGLEVEQQQLHQLLEQYMFKIYCATPQELHNTLWALTKFNHQITDEQLQCLMQAFIRRLREAPPESISMTIWSVASLGCHLQDSQLEPLVARLCQTDAQHPKPEDISRTLWAVAIMKQQIAPRYREQALFLFVKKLDKASPQAISNTLWAAATMGWRITEQQLHQMLTALVKQLPDVQPQDISSSLFAVVTMGRLPQHDLIQQLLAAFVGLLPQAKPQAVANTLWACAKIKLLPVDLMNALKRHQKQGRGLFKAGSSALQDLAQVAWAVAQLGYADPQLHGALLRLAVLQLQQEGLPGISRSGTLQDLCSICWSVAILDLQQHIDLLLVLAERCGRHKHWEHATEEERAQLYQVHLWLLDCQHSGLYLAGISAEQLQQGRAVWMSRGQLASDSRRRAASSLLQLDVFEQLQRLPVKWQRAPQLEQLCQPDGVIKIDVTALTESGLLLAVEADGPSHFRWPEEDQGLMGSTLYRNRALAARGYTVISVPYFIWSTLPSKAAKQQWLAQQIAEHAGNERSSG